MYKFAVPTKLFEKRIPDIYIFVVFGKAHFFERRLFVKDPRHISVTNISWLNLTEKIII
jgi:hypothetical protein